MQSAGFISVLKNAKPDREELQGFGLSPEGIELVLNTFRVQMRSVPPAHPARSELERLVAEHDCSTVEVAMIHFLDGPRPHPGGVHVADVEADPLVVEPDGCVTAFDFGTGRRIFACAIDSEHFLEALAEFVRMVHELKSWKTRADEAANLCAAKAGGGEYFDFYRRMSEFFNH